MNEKIRVLHIVSGNMNIAGQETFIMNVFRNINRNIFVFDFLCLVSEKGDYDEEIKNLGGTVYSLPRNKNKMVDFFSAKRKIFEFLKEHNNYNIVHIHFCSSHYPYMIAKAAIQSGIKKVIVHSHSNSCGSKLRHRLMHYYYRPKLNNLSISKFACSLAAGQWLFGKKTTGIKVINNAIDIEKFVFNSDLRIQVRAEMGLENKIVLGHIGRFDEVKNHSFLIDIFNELAKLHNNAVLLLVGKGPLLISIQNKVENLGLASKVHFLGMRQDVHRLLNAMDVFCFPSFYEGFGIVLLEARINGLNCLVNKNGIPQETINTLNLEIKSLNESPINWAKIINLLAKNRTSSENIAKNFDIKNVVKELENYYKNEGIYGAER
jgi:Glycosyltransferase